MPRSESRTKTSIWAPGSDFRKLTKDAQRMYWQLYSQATITLCGVVALTERRWSQTASDETPEAVRAALIALEDASYVSIDWDTEEVLVRTFARHDGIKPGSTVWHKAWDLLDHIASDGLRAEAERQLSRIGADPRRKILSTDPRQLSTDDLASDDQTGASPVDNGPDPAKPLANTPSDTPGATPPDGVPDTHRTRVRAASVSSLRLQPPSTPKSHQPVTHDPRDEPRDETGAQPPDAPTGRDGTQLANLASRLAHACTARADIAQAEAAAVVAWAAARLDTRLIDEAVTWAEQRPNDTRIALPRAAAAVLHAKAHDHGIALAPYDPHRMGTDPPTIVARAR